MSGASKLFLHEDVSLFVNQPYFRIGASYINTKNNFHGLKIINIS